MRQEKQDRIDQEMNTINQQKRVIQNQIDSMREEIRKIQITGQLPLVNRQKAQDLYKER